ncbi:Hypothetical protein SMAX5B_015049 [Scophthalmus maximus]|uniref:Uncharacterized protein n=1 Tax=Scophthalmus maximus TaxID=52904 RepID=A0A2U9BHR8_SCOMX|nr:Hypothetical protein SMAX5B_015049 [Scophthalmus maximus]
MTEIQHLVYVTQGRSGWDQVTEFSVSTALNQCCVRFQSAQREKKKENPGANEGCVLGCVQIMPPEDQHIFTFMPSSYAHYW